MSSDASQTSMIQKKILHNGIGKIPEFLPDSKVKKRLNNNLTKFTFTTFFTGKVSLFNKSDY